MHVMNNEKWYFISNGYYYVYLDPSGKHLRYSNKMNYDILDNYLFRFYKAKEYINPNLYFDYFNTQYDSIETYNLVCKAYPELYIYPEDINKNLNSIITHTSYIANQYWLFLDYDNINELNKNMLVNNLVYLDKNTNHQGGFFRDTKIYLNSGVNNNGRYCKVNKEIELSSIVDKNMRVQRISYVSPLSGVAIGEDDTVTFETEQFSADDNLYDTELNTVYGQGETIYVLVDPLSEDTYTSEDNSSDNSTDE